MDQEKELVIVALEKCSALAWPCATEEIKLMINTYLDSVGKKTVLKDNSPGKAWMISF